MKYALWLFATGLVFIVLTLAFTADEEETQQNQNIQRQQGYKKHHKSTKIIDT